MWLSSIFLFAVIMDNIDMWVWICIALIAFEGIILVIFKNVCPVNSYLAQVLQVKIFCRQFPVPDSLFYALPPWHIYVLRYCSLFIFIFCAGSLLKRPFQIIQRIGKFLPFFCNNFF